MAEGPLVELHDTGLSPIVASLFLLFSITWNRIPPSCSVVFQTRMMTPRNRPPRGLFITLEGTEGCGKSTQAKLLGEHLRNQGYDTVETREPGGTPLAEKIRSLLLDRADEPVAPETEAFLVLAAAWFWLGSAWGWDYSCFSLASRGQWASSHFSWASATS